jgi:hypothetical protein
VGTGSGFRKVVIGRHAQARKPRKVGPRLGVSRQREPGPDVVFGVQPRRGPEAPGIHGGLDGQPHGPLGGREDALQLTYPHSGPSVDEAFFARVHGRFLGARAQKGLVDACFGQAVGVVLRRRHPFHTAKLVARDTGCTIRSAQNILRGHLQARTLTRLVLTYGPWFLLEAYGHMTQQDLGDLVATERESGRQQFEAKERHLVALEDRVRHRLATDNLAAG